MTRTVQDAGAPVHSVTFTRREVDTLVRLADYYLTIRPLRLLVSFTAPRAIRRRYRYIADESRWLKRFAKAVRVDMQRRGIDELSTGMSVPSIIAFWGRILASLNTPRSRRKLSRSEIETREGLSARFAEVLRALEGQRRRQIEEHLQTRRPSEEIWMRQKLGFPIRPGLPDAAESGATADE